MRFLWPKNANSFDFPEILDSKQFHAHCEMLPVAYIGNVTWLKLFEGITYVYNIALFRQDGGIYCMINSLRTPSLNLKNIGLSKRLLCSANICAPSFIFSEFISLDVYFVHALSWCLLIEQPVSNLNEKKRYHWKGPAESQNYSITPPEQSTKL